MIRHHRTITVTEPDTNDDGTWNLATFKYRHVMMVSQEYLIEWRLRSGDLLDAEQRLWSARQSFRDWLSKLPLVVRQENPIHRFERDHQTDFLRYTMIRKGVFELTDVESANEKMLSYVGTTYQFATTSHIPDLIDRWDDEEPFTTSDMRLHVREVYHGPPQLRPGTANNDIHLLLNRDDGLERRLRADPLIEVMDRRINDAISLGARMDSILPLIQIREERRDQLRREIVEPRRRFSINWADWRNTYGTFNES